MLLDGDVLPYDVLVVASGSRLQPDETDGLTGPGWNERVFTFYAPDSAQALRLGLTMDDFVPEVEDIISVGELDEKAVGGQIIFT